MQNISTKNGLWDLNNVTHDALVCKYSLGAHDVGTF